MGDSSVIEAMAQAKTISIQDLKTHCIDTLSEAGASLEYCEFFGEALQCEYDLNTIVHKIHQALSSETSYHKDPAKLLKIVQDLTRNFTHWRSTVEGLAQLLSRLPPMRIDSSRVNDTVPLTPSCNMQTQQIKLNEGENVTITDTSQPNKLKVKTNKGEEGYVPVLPCILPTPDKNAKATLSRLRIQLLASWTESIKKTREQILQCLQALLRQLPLEWIKSVPPGSDVTCYRDRVSRRTRRVSEVVNKHGVQGDLSKLHNALFSLEKELGAANDDGADLSTMIHLVSDMDKTILCQQVFCKHLAAYRSQLSQQGHNICMQEQWEQRAKPANGKNVKYYEVKTTLENVETREEITYVTPDENWRSEGGAAEENVDTDEITQSTNEEQKRFVITAVVDPRDDAELSVQDAVDRGILDFNTGSYRNPDTGERTPIPVAMNTGKIKVSHTETSKTKEETKAIGLITIKQRIDDRRYNIEKVVDANTGEKISYKEAVKRNLINEEKMTYKIATSGELLPIDIAVLRGWILVEYEEDENKEPVYDTKTYAVSFVVDQKNKKKVPFLEAVKIGLIERKTGTYVNNLTGEKMYVGEAIKRGLLKAKEVDQSHGLDIDAENKIVIELTDRLRRNVMNSISAISAFKRNANVAS